MVLRHVWFAVLGVAALGWSGVTAAQQYRADEFLNLDLSRAVLSPKPLGPAATFTPGPLAVTIDRGTNAARADAELLVEPRTVAIARVHVEAKAAAKSPTRTALRTTTSRTRVAHARRELSASHAPRALVALHKRNPMEAQARDTEIQVWPCKSRGICNWKR